MNTKTLFTTLSTALLFSWSGIAMAVGPEGNTGMPMRDASPNMRTDVPDHRSPGMYHMQRGDMMGMMSGCPMMSAAGGPNGKVMMQMHGEMMRAMGDIMMKYADKLDTSSAAQ